MQDLKRRQQAERALREERVFVTRRRDPGRPHTVPRPFALHGGGVQQVRVTSWPATHVVISAPMYCCAVEGNKKVMRRHLDRFFPLS